MNHSKHCNACYTKYELLTINGKDYIDGTNGLCDECYNQEQESTAETDRKESWRQRWRNTVGAEYADTDPEHEGFDRDMYLLARGWINQPKSQPFLQDEKKDFIGFIGTNGTCKTRYMAMMLKDYIASGTKYSWINGAKFMKAAKVAARYSDVDKGVSTAMLRQARTVPVLFFDEAGSLSSDDEVVAEFLEMIEYRKSRYLATIWTSNETPEEMFSALPNDDWSKKRILSKFLGNSNLLNTNNS